MSKTHFKFKQFAVTQEKSAMKISTDAVVLGAISGKGTAAQILDIGLGTGVVALMLAQRFPKAKITGVELDQEAWTEAKANAADSPWANRMDFKQMSFQDFFDSCTDKFDLIVSNPPYFPDHLKSKDAQRNLALHNDALPFAELAEGVSKLLSPEGQFWVILPPRQMEELEAEAGSVGLYPAFRLELKDREDKPLLRVVQSFGWQKRTLSTEQLYIKDTENKYSSEYSRLLKDFLLIF